MMRYTGQTNNVLEVRKQGNDITFGIATANGVCLEIDIPITAIYELTNALSEVSEALPPSWEGDSL